MLWRLRPSDTDIELHTYTRQMCIDLEERTGQASWSENGGLFVACTAERMAEYERLGETGRYFGIESSVLSPAETKALHPLLAVDDVYGSLYSPTDGTIDPSGVVTQYSKAARALGARVFEGVSLESLETAEVSPGVRRVTAAVAAGGHKIRTPVVINAAGAWGGAVAAMAGAELPLRALKHAFVVTEAIEGMQASP